MRTKQLFGCVTKGEVTLGWSNVSWPTSGAVIVTFTALALFGQSLGMSSSARGQSSKTGQSQKLRTAADSASVSGDKIFAVNCAGCHGLDGRGGDRAPSIATASVQRRSDAEIFAIIEHGITGTGMPSFHSLADSEIKALVAHLRTLQGMKQAISLPGNPKHGKILFFGKAGCSGCHMAAGEGGFIASDLSSYARTHSVDETRSAITAPNPNGDRLARAATVTTRNGEKYVGRVRNEDNFSLQLQGLDGAFHFFAKSDIQGLEYNSQPLMPSSYGSTLSSDELNDLVGYMVSLANGTESEAREEGSDED